MRINALKLSVVVGGLFFIFMNSFSLYAEPYKKIPGGYEITLNGTIVKLFTRTDLLVNITSIDGRAYIFLDEEGKLMDYSILYLNDGGSYFVSNDCTGQLFRSYFEKIYEVNTINKFPPFSTYFNMLQSKSKLFYVDTSKLYKVNAQSGYESGKCVKIKKAIMGYKMLDNDPAVTGIPNPPYDFNFENPLRVVAEVGEPSNS